MKLLGLVLSFLISGLLVAWGWGLGQIRWNSQSAVLQDKAVIEARNNTVKVVSISDEGYSQGTGTFISPTEILTEAHVTTSSKNVVYNPLWGGFEPTVVVSSDGVKDFAILHIDKPSPYYAIYSQSIPVGENVVVVGNPRQKDFVAVYAPIIGLAIVDTPLGYEREMIMIDGSLMGPGFSGAGLFYKGKVIGMLELCNPLSRVCYAITSREIIENAKVIY